MNNYILLLSCLKIEAYACFYPLKDFPRQPAPYSVKTESSEVSPTDIKWTVSPPFAFSALALLDDRSTGYAARRV